MKKRTILLLSLLVSVTALFGQSKVVVVEEITGTWCSWCPRGDIYGQELLHDYPGQAVFISVHSGDAMEYTDYINALGLTGLPSGKIDRTGLSIMQPANLASEISPFLAQTAPANISVSTTWDSVTRNVTMIITATMTANLSGDFRLAGVVTEDAITGPSPDYDQSNSYSGGTNGPMGGYEMLTNPVPADLMVYNHVARHIAGGFLGDAGSLPANMVIGQSYSYTYSWTVPAGYNEDNIEVIGMMINVSDGSIVNAGKSNYLPGYANGKPFFHSSPYEYAALGLQYNYYIIAHDPENDSMDISISSGPSWLNVISLANGKTRLSGIPPALGNYPVSLSVTDGNWNVFQDFTLVVSAMGQDWVQVGAPGFSNSPATFLDLHFDAQGTPYAISAIYSTSSAQLYKYQNNQWTAFGPALNPVNPYALGMYVAADGTPYVAYNGKALKMVNNTWNQIGANYSTNQLMYTDIIIAGDGSPHVVVFDISSGTGAAFKYDGTSWISTSPLGGQGVWNKMTLDNNGNPVVIYGTDGSNIAYSQVSQYNGTGWQVVGGGYIEPSEQTYYDHDVTVSQSGQMYAALIKGTSGQELNVYQLVMGSWTLLADNLGGGSAGSCKIEASTDGKIIVSYLDGTNSGRVSAKMYDGTSWQYLGIPGFTSISMKQELELDNQGIPYVAYRDGDLNSSLSVKKFVDLTTSSPEFSTTPAVLSIYPNPNRGIFTVTYSAGTQYQIMDILGRTVDSGELNQDFQNHKATQQLNIAPLTEGVYLIKILGGSGTNSIKFTKKN
jgi:hypothetical protein